MVETRCPHCDHVFVMAEITDEWCAECGKHIPEALLKDVRPKPHLRNPHPHPLPPQSKEDQVAQSHETKLRLAGLLTMLGAILVGMICAGWGVVNQMRSAEIGTGPWVGGGIALVAFFVGVVLLNRGQTAEEE
jgi:hypothetical protein